MNPLPPGARAHMGLGAEGAALSEDQRSLPRVLFAALCATLILIAAPLAWATSALGADQGSSPVATLSKSGAGGSGHGGDDDGDDDSNTTTSRGTATTQTRTTTGKKNKRAVNETTTGGAKDDTKTTTDDTRGTTDTRTTTGS
jgi:hypothetical protein